MLGAFILVVVVLAYVAGYATAYATQRWTDPHLVPTTATIPTIPREDKTA